jgi:hypothetical protein
MVLASTSALGLGGGRRGALVGATGGPVIVEWASAGSPTLTIVDGSFTSGQFTALWVVGPTSISGTSFSSTTGGPPLRFDAGATGTVSGCFFQNNAPAILVNGGDVTVRTTMFTNNDRAVVSTGSLVNLGTSADPGGNTMTSTFAAASLYVTSVSSGTLQAVGNTWKPSTQGSDVAGHYSIQLIAGPQSGPNYLLPAGVSIQF